MIPASVPVVCLATGTLYGRADTYIARLHSMLNRHCRVPFRLTCYSDRPRKVPAAIHVAPAASLMPEFDSQTHPTYYKLGLFNAEAVPFEQFLYLDLSLVIRQNMKSLLDYAFGAPQELVIVNEWSYPCYNSSVMKIRRGALQTIYDAFIEGERYPQQHLDTDQDFIYAHIKAQKLEDRVAFFPPEQIISYKRTRYLSEEGASQMERAKQMIAASTIVKFHGNPKMHHIAKRPRNPFKSLDSSLFKRELYENWR